MRLRLRFFLMALIVSLGPPGLVSAQSWESDVASAIERARRDAKDLLFDFTGSDWCPPCIQLDRDVLSKPEFLAEAGKDFVLVRLDFPQDASGLSEAVIAQNAEWRQRLAITQFPTLVLLDAETRPYDFTGFREEGVEGYVAHLRALREKRVARDAAFREAQEAEGVERARLLDQGLQALDRQIAEVYYADVIREIVELDADDAAGLRTKYNEAQERELQRALLSDIAMVARLRSPEVAVQFIDEAMKTVRLAPATRYQVLLTKLDLLRRAQRAGEAEAVIDQMMAIEGLGSVDQQKLIVKKVWILYGDGRADEARRRLDEAIAGRSDHAYLLLALGELTAAEGKPAEALPLFERALRGAAADAELARDATTAQADALLARDGEATAAIAALDAFAADPQWPAIFRAEGLLHKSMILRETDRRRAAILAENKAIELVENPIEKAQVQRWVDQLRRRYERAGESGAG